MPHYSLKAISNILPFLKSGYSLYDATLLGGVVSVLGRKYWLELSEAERDKHTEEVIKRIRNLG